MIEIMIQQMQFFQVSIPPKTAVEQGLLRMSGYLDATSLACKQIFPTTEQHIFFQQPLSAHIT